MREFWALGLAAVAAGACTIALGCGDSFTSASADAGAAGASTAGGTAGGTTTSGAGGDTSTGASGGTTSTGGTPDAGNGGAMTAEGGSDGVGGSSTGGFGGSHGGSAGGGGAAGGVGTGSGTGGAGGGMAGTDGGANLSFCPGTGTELPLPLVVDDNFVPSGYFADTQANVFGIKATPCAARPVNPAGHVGTCHAFQFQAAETSPLDGTAFGGLVWQAPHDNWGNLPGIKVQAGATRVKFRAWATTGSATVTFSAGGTIGTCSDDVQFSRKGAITIALSTTATEYEINLQGQAYPHGIIGGFLWFANVTSTNQVVSFAVDDIEWVK
jgi:hypothetical protein